MCGPTAEGSVWWQSSKATGREEVGGVAGGRREEGEGAAVGVLDSV